MLQGLAIGDLVARVEAPTVIYRVTSQHAGHARILPFRRSGRELILVPLKRGSSTWIGDGSQWLLTGRS